MNNWIIFIIISSGSLLTSCSNDPLKSDEPINNPTTDTVYKEVTNTLSYSKELINNWDGPILSIVNFGAFWSKECSSSEPFDNTNNLIDSAYSYLGTDSIISIGLNGIQPQKLINIYCMGGECGGDQVAFKLLNKEPLGVIVPTTLFQGDSVLIFNPRHQPTIAEIKELRDSSISAGKSLFYTNANQSVIIELKGNGYEQENDWPIYTEIYWRLIQKIDKQWVVYEWDQFPFESTDLSRPVAIAITNNEVKIIWINSQGIGSGEGKMWITRINQKREIEHGRMYIGGLGQPCD